MERLQSRYRWAVRAAGLLTLLGLFGMHGLPDAMASPGGAPAMHGTAQMSSPPATSAHAGEHAGEPASTPPVDHAARTRERVARLARQASQAADRSATAPSGCPMNHAGCVAVLRDAGQLTPAAAGLAVAATPVMSGLVPVSNPANAPRAPPDVSLLGLGISRT